MQLRRMSKRKRRRVQQSHQARKKRSRNNLLSQLKGLKIWHKSLKVKEKILEHGVEG
jgi:hypothetical protein